MFPLRTLRPRATIVLLLVALPVLGACGSSQDDVAAEAAGAGEMPKVRLAVGIDASYAPFFLADETGMFQEAGVDVEGIQFGRGGEAVDALATGDINLAASSDTTTISQLNVNPNLRALLVYEESGEYLKVVAREGIGSVDEIKKMGIVPGLSELSALKLLESEGVDPSKVEFVSAGPPELPALLDKGDIDAFVLWEPWPTRALDLGSKVLMNTGDYGWSYVHWLIGTEQWIEENPETASTIARVLDEAAQLTEEDPDAAAEATQAAAKVAPEETLKAIEEIDFEVRDITEEDLPGYKSIAEFYLNTGKAEKLPPVEDSVMLDWFSENAQA
jgi:NitT/TauT family transport system substrate-binding protein